jgi:hypothetical protein
MQHHSASVRDAATAILPNLVEDCVYPYHVCLAANAYGGAYHFPLVAFYFRHITQLLHDPNPDVVVSALTLISALTCHGRSFIQYPCS